MSVSLTHWPTEDRPRERLIDQGAGSLTEVDLLALLLRSGSRLGSAVDLAGEIQRYVKVNGGWSRLRAQELARIPGMGLAKAATLLAAFEWSRRLSVQKEIKEKNIKGSSDAWYFCKQKLAEKNKESFLVVALDARNRPVGQEIISTGTLTQSLVHPREVFSPLLRLGAAAFLVAHNHPSGDPRPSEDDHSVTRRLKECAEIFSIPLLDHLVVTENQYHSYADSGWKGIKKK